ncbi:MAG: DUF1501 domain-containing protein [Acidobacteria bacterium]|nr:DUF1501 domain-containing protein [Acidobacteriota bacterium]
MANAKVPEWQPKHAVRPQITPITGPVVGRRDFFKIAGTGVAGFALTPMLAGAAKAQYGAKLVGKARNCIFILLTGAPSHSDTFDLKVGAWTPTDFNPTTYNGTLFPQGLMPKLAERLNKFAIIRSLRAPALVHALQQTWVQIARSPSSALGKIAPNIGSVVALEFEKLRTASQKLPVFVSLNTGQNVVGPGYFPGLYAPFDTTAAPTGITSLVNADGQTKFEQRYGVLQMIDSRLRQNSPLGDDAATMGSFYDRGKGMMYDPAVDAVFKFSTEDQVRYGGTSTVGQTVVNGNAFGNSLIVARNLIKANQGCRYVQVNFGSWDHHQDIYAKAATPNQTVPGIYQMAGDLDDGLANLLDDLAASPGVNGGTLLDETLVVAMGEFGRTVGPLTNQDGRDHYFQQFAVMAGGGVSGGRIIGETTSDGGNIKDPGWSQGRAVAYEDIAATIYSALGIDYTTIRRDDPFGRGFEYVPFASEGAWYPVLELFSRDIKSRAPIIGRDAGGRRIG